MMYELAVIGGGPAGLAAALGAYQNGLRKILIIERDRDLGGILNQCIHNGFGLHKFKEELTGPEYAWRYIEQLPETTIEVLDDSMVLDFQSDLKGIKHIHIVNTTQGYREIVCQSIILAMGCRERTIGAIGIPGDRPAGIFTAGTAQRYINLDGYVVGKRIVILGSGDIGLIMARRLTLEGAEVLACVELMPYSSGLTRNIVQCLEDYQIPLYLSHTITNIEARGGRVNRVTVQKVDAARQPVPGSELHFDCDTLLLSVGLIPENELTRAADIALDSRTNGPVVYETMETTMPGVFACGNVVHVHDLVDNVSAESEYAGISAANYVRALQDHKDAAVTSSQIARIEAGNGITYTVPQLLRWPLQGKTLRIYFRTGRIYEKCAIELYGQDSAGKLEQFHSVTKEFVSPGEMQHVDIPGSCMNNNYYEKIELQCRDLSEGGR